MWLQFHAHPHESSPFRGTRFGCDVIEILEILKIIGILEILKILEFLEHF